MAIRRRLTPEEAMALEGTAGTPGPGNKFVTDADVRLAAAGEGIATSIEALPYLPALSAGRVVYLTETVGEGYEAHRMYLGVP